MVNLSVAYAGPVPAAATLWGEVKTRWPDCAESKGFVAGSGPTLWNISSHNADANGRAHALDIGVDIEGDGTGIPVADGIELSETLRAIGYTEWLDGRVGRLAYIIHRGRIAGDHTGWAWTPYAGISPHFDHIHVSFSYDFAWGDPVWESTAEYNSTAPWGVATMISGQSSGIAPIEKEWEDMDENEIAAAVWSMPITLRDGTKGRALDHFVNLCGSVKLIPTVNTVFKSAGDKSEARLQDILGNVGPDLRAVKTKTDRLP